MNADLKKYNLFENPWTLWYHHVCIPTFSQPITTSLFPIFLTTQRFALSVQRLSGTNLEIQQTLQILNSCPPYSPYPNLNFSFFEFCKLFFCLIFCESRFKILEHLCFQCWSGCDHIGFLSFASRKPLTHYNHASHT